MNGSVIGGGINRRCHVEYYAMNRLGLTNHTNRAGWLAGALWLLLSGICHPVAAATISIEGSFLSYDENSGTATIRVSRVGDTSALTTVRYATADVRATSATAGVDYRPLNGLIFFGAGETNKTISLTINDDPIVEGDELLELILSEPSGGDSLGTTSKATIAISDNEKPGMLQDTTFAPSFDASDFVQLSALQADGKLIVAGSYLVPGTTFYERLRRLNSDGSIDTTFEPSGGPDAEVYAVTPLADGKILIGGAFTNVGSAARPGIARLNANGSLDTTFGSSNTISGSNAPLVLALGVQPDGKIVIGGGFDSVGGVPRRDIARLNSDGSLDTSFDPGAGASLPSTGFSAPWVGALAIQQDGRIIVGGQFFQFDTVPCTNFVRLFASGAVDASFVTGTGASGTSATVDAIALQADGKILVGGAFGRFNGVRRSGIARVNPNGTLDPTFDPGSGALLLDPDGSLYIGDVWSITVAPDQKILLAGQFSLIDLFTEPGFARLNPDGTLDQTLDASPGTTLRDPLGYLNPRTVYSLNLQPDGMIVLAATWRNFGGVDSDRVARIAPTNSLRNTIEFPVRLAFVPEGAGLTNLSVIRRGSSSNTVTVDYTVQAISATAGQDFNLTAGTLSFAPLETEKFIPLQLIRDGRAENDEQLNLGLRNPSAPAILGSPATNTINIIDGERPGSLDMTFANVTIPFPSDPVTDRPVAAVIVQPDGKIVVAGSYRSISGVPQAGVARLNSDGTIDPDFQTDFDASGYGYYFFRMVQQSDGAIIGGYSGLARIQPDGEYDDRYVPLVEDVWSLALQRDGRLLVGEGYADAATGQTLYSLTRLRSNGDFDSSFLVDVNGPITAIVVQSDGRVVIGGDFTQVNSTARNRIARVLSNGAVDTSFNPGLGIQGSTPFVLDVVPYPGGKVVVAGLFSSVNGVTRRNIAMLTSTGALDTSFNPGSGPDYFVESIAVQNDGKMVIGGDFTSIAGVLRVGLARLTATGSLDTTFSQRLGFDSYVSVAPVVLQPDGKVLAGGLLSSVAGLRRSGLARLIGGDPPVSLSLTQSARSPDGLFRFSFSTVAGRIYAIQSSVDLTNWIQTDVVTGTGSMINYQETASSPSTYRYYRAVLLP